MSWAKADSPARLVVALLFGLLAAAAPVSAHSDLASSEPMDGQRLEEAPRWVVLHFSGGIESSASSVRVLDAAGQRVDRDDLRTTGGGSPILNISLRDGLGEGAYVARWSVLSDDGHPNSGRVTFTVGNATALPPGGDGQIMPTAGSVAGRLLSYLGLALGFGAIAWLWWVRAGVDGMARPAGLALAAGAFLHAAGSLVLFSATMGSTGLTAQILATSTTGQLLLLRAAAALLALALASLALGRPAGEPWARMGAAGLLGVATLATAAAGHAASQGLAGAAVDAMHLVASAMWVGGLVLLIAALALTARRGLPVEAVRRIGLRFGTVALACVIVLVLSGTATAIVILGRTAILDPLHLTGSLYGGLLLAKVGLAALMVALAAANRFIFLGPPVGRAGLRARLASLGPDGTAAGLRRTVAVEAFLGVLVLVVAAFLTAVSPTDHEEDHSSHVHAPPASTSAAVQPSPASSLVGSALRHVALGSPGESGDPPS